MDRDIDNRTAPIGRRELLAAAAAVLATLAIGIRGNAHDKTPTPPETPRTDAPGKTGASLAGSPTASPVATGPMFESTIQSLKYLPPEIDIEAGTTVVWTNEDVVAHTVTHKVKVEDQLFASPMLAPGDQFSFTFEKPGTYPVYCLPHPFMSQTVKVSENP